jgi:hypothetical protein
MIFPKIQTFPTNWENGMKLNADHFQHMENSIEDSIRDCRASSVLANSSYGILPYSQFSLMAKPGSSLNSVVISLIACRAIFPGGYRVEILPENVQQLQIPIKTPTVEIQIQASMRYHIFLVMGPHRIAAGPAQTRPIRFPYLVPDYNIEVVPQDKMHIAQNISPNRMKIGELMNGNIIEGYIPAALCIKGNAFLEQWHNHFLKILDQIAKVSTQVMHEYRTKDQAKVIFCSQILQFVKSTQSTFRWMLPMEPPINLACYLGDFACFTEGVLDSIDRDFSRNILKDGAINGLRNTIQELNKFAAIPLEEMALVLTLALKFLESLTLTIQGLISTQAPIPRFGESQRIQS